MAKFTSADLPTDSASLVEFLKGLSPAQLAEAEKVLNTELDTAQDRKNASDEADPDLAAMTIKVEQILAIRAETEGRVAESSAKIAEAAKLRSTIAPKATTEEPADEPAPDAEPTPDDDGGTAGEEPPVPADVEAVAASMGKAIVASIAEAFAALPRMENPPKAELVPLGGPSLNRHLSLGAASQYAPDAQVPARRGEGSVLVASADIPGFAQGTNIDDSMQLANILHHRARMMGVSHNGDPTPALVASMNRTFKHRLDLDSPMDVIEQVLRDATDVDAMVAAGGWCAPSEISYDFFNIVCEDGMIDLPSVGVLNRGGFRFPTAPTYADVINGSPDGLWTWTETDDQSAVTGAPVKDCVRVPCPSFNDVRLACDGFCVTAGNLIDFAYPENVANWIRLVMATRAHVTNSRVISILQAASTAVVIGLPTGGVYGDLMDAVALSAADYRARFAMCNDAILEVILPTWIVEAVQTDWARRDTSTDEVMTRDRLMRGFDARNVRVQFVQDYQVRTSGKPGASSAITTFPAQGEFMIYAPGTFVRGQGLQLNLGVVRDSVLNATNDMTAAWAEDCYAVAQVGHLSRKVTFNICVAGTIGARNITC